MIAYVCLFCSPVVAEVVSGMAVGLSEEKRLKMVCKRCNRSAMETMWAKGEGRLCLDCHNIARCGATGTKEQKEQFKADLDKRPGETRKQQKTYPK